MKKFFCLLLALLLACTALAGCDRRSESSEKIAEDDPNFAPETTAVGGLTQAVEGQSPAEGAGEQPSASPTPETGAEGAEAAEGEASDEQPVPQDQTAGAPQEAESTPSSPFASPTPQPNASVSQYSEISAQGLGFRFSYPTNWINIPGRSTVCYVQPLEDGTVYPARVAVTMKRMPHKVTYDEARSELAEYVKTLMTQYDPDTFKVDKNLDTETKFMGNRAYATTYLAYDGPQEIKGYAIITYFERYLFVFHFLCAYDDYESFEAALRYMRDSVQADDSVAPD